jgi:hypothetical protein
MGKFMTQILYSLLLFLLVGCSSANLKTEKAEIMALDYGFKKSITKTSDFNLMSYKRFKNNNVVNVYIEGDGLAWQSRTKISPNPTPTDPIALKLAIADNSENVVYIARPCQFIRFGEDKCSKEFWTQKRFAPEVIESYMQLLDGLDFKKINLFGYSGGGAVATILAAKRKDVESLTTIAGNLDIDKFAEIHQVSKLNGSLNPANFAEYLGEIKQTHYIGLKDKIIPIEIYNSYSKKLPTRNNSKVIIIDNIGHEGDWHKHLVVNN